MDRQIRNGIGGQAKFNGQVGNDSSTHHCQFCHVRQLKSCRTRRYGLLHAKHNFPEDEQQTLECTGYHHCNTSDASESQTHGLKLPILAVQVIKNIKSYHVVKRRTFCFDFWFLTDSSFQETTRAMDFEQKLVSIFHESTAKGTGLKRMILRDVD